MNRDEPSNPVGKINETKRIATDIDTSIPAFLKRKKGDKPKPAATALVHVDHSDPYGGPVWYLHQKTNDIGSDDEPKSVIAHKGDFYENSNDREHHYKEREHSSEEQSVEGPITNHIGSEREPKSVMAHKGDFYENPNDREHQ
jgi:hypothetical protein